MRPDPLATDLYELTMAAGYVHNGRAEDRVTCEAMFRRQSSARRFYVAAGVSRVLDFLEGLSFNEEELAFLAEVPGLKPAITPAVIERLRSLRFTGDVWAIPEGEVVFAGEPLIRVSAPLIEAQLVETFVLSVYNHALTVAAKAARVVIAAAGRPVAEFGARRTDPEAAPWASRAAYLAGFSSTSNVGAGRRFGVPLSGTMAHQWVMSFASEEAAFRTWRGIFPESTLLIDTYDTERGAVRAAASGPGLTAVRLDSGDLVDLARKVRASLDAAGQTSTLILATNDLDEYSIRALLTAGAPIDGFGVGTSVVASPDAPTVGAVYKLVDDPRAGGPRIKLSSSTGKATWPGTKQVFRGVDGDLIGLADETPPDGSRPLLVEVMRGGQRTEAGREPLTASRDRARAAVANLPDELRSLEPSDARPPVRHTSSLERLTAEARARALAS